MRFEVETMLKGVTMNPEKNGEEAGDIGSAMRFEEVVLVDKLEDLFKSKASFHAITGSWWRKDGEIAAQDIGDTKLTCETENADVLITAAFGAGDKLDLKGVKVKKCKLSPMPNKTVMFGFTVYGYPTDDVLVLARDLINKNCKVSVAIGQGKTQEEKKTKQGSLPVSQEQTTH